YRHGKIKPPTSFLTRWVRPRSAHSFQNCLTIDVAAHNTRSRVCASRHARFAAAEIDGWTRRLAIKLVSKAVTPTAANSSRSQPAAHAGQRKRHSRLPLKNYRGRLLLRPRCVRITQQCAG